MGSTWGRQVPGGPHVGHVNLAIWGYTMYDTTAMWSWYTMETWVLYWDARFRQSHVNHFYDIGLTFSYAPYNFYVPLFDENYLWVEHKMFYDTWVKPDPELSLKPYSLSYFKIVHDMIWRWSLNKGLCFTHRQRLILSGGDINSHCPLTIIRCYGFIWAPTENAVKW